MVESASDEILAGADVLDIAFLVVGDPFGYDGRTTILDKYSLRLTNHCIEPLPTPILFFELESSRSRYKACTMPL